VADGSGVNVEFVLLFWLRLTGWSACVVCRDAALVGLSVSRGVSLPGLHQHIDNRQSVLDATDIVELVGEHVALKSKGREFVGLCPFHEDRHPSMYVVPHKQIFHCFVCGSGGNAIDFLMKLHGMGFREALEHLANRAGMEIAPFHTRSGSRSDDATPSVSRDDLARANAFAMGFFQTILAHAEHGRAARALIESRNITPEMVEHFGIGAAPDRWDGLEQVVRGKGMSSSHFVEAGLLKEKDGRHYDALRNRMVFPIQDQANRIVAFGARRINDEDEPKYLNSPESKLFDKGATLFGLKQAARAIQRERTCVVTEGYTDVIACHQHGFENVVATLGTALTAKHAPVLRRMCDTVILLFDGDDAGQRAADRALEVFFTEPMDVRIAVMQREGGGQDPDEILKEDNGAEMFREILSGAVDWME